jgi:hypothetical protein
MGLKAKHGWVKADEYHVKNAHASICKNTVNDEVVYILWPNMKAPPGARICLGPFKTAEEAEAEYEAFWAASATVKAGDISQGGSGTPHNEGRPM